MSLKLRRFKEHPVEQGEDEIIAYWFDTTPWGGSPSNPVTVLKDEDGADQSATYLTGASSVDADKIYTAAVQALVKGHRYRLEVSWENEGNTLEAYMDVVCSEE